MKRKNSERNIVFLLKRAIATLFEHKKILLPFFIIIFVQLLVLEILYFAPRYPLNIFFGPVISTMWSERYLHYPANLLLLPKLFQYVQIPIYIFVSSFFISVAIGVMININDRKIILLRAIIKRTWPAYIHIVATAALSFLCMLFFLKIYGWAFDYALNIPDDTPMLVDTLKRVIVEGGPYLNLLFSVLVTTFFAYMFPIIVIERKRFWQALVINFEMVSRFFWITFLMVMIPSLCFVPMIILRNSYAIQRSVPEVGILALILSIFVIVAIDAVVYTALTSFYLFKKDR